MNKSRFYAPILLLSSLAAIPMQAQTSFYMTLLQRGTSDALRGAWPHAVDELRIAAFGLVDDLPNYQTAQVLISIGSDKLGHPEDAKLAASKVVQAEIVAPTYRSLTLDPTMRAAFDKLVRTVLPAEQLAGTPWARGAVQTTPPAQPRATSPAPITTTSPAPITTTAPAPITIPLPSNHSAKTPVAPVTKPTTASTVAAAQARLDAGDEAGARKLAEQAVTQDQSNASAHELLGRIAARQHLWSEAVIHFATARTRQRLTDEENGLLFIALVNTGRFTDAGTLRPSLSAATLATPEVRQALDKLTPPQPPPAAAKPSASTAQPSNNTTFSQPALTPPPATPKPSTSASRTSPRTSSTPATTTTTTTQTPSQTSVSPLVAASKHSPSQVPDTSDVPEKLAEAQKLLNAGKIAAARQTLAHLMTYPNVPRNLVLEIARGLNQTSAWHDSSQEYSRIFPLQQGEEMHMFYEAVNRYELGELNSARELLARALPYIPATREVALYRARIEGR